MALLVDRAPRDGAPDGVMRNDDAVSISAMATSATFIKKLVMTGHTGFALHYLSKGMTTSAILPTTPQGMENDDSSKHSIWIMALQHMDYGQDGNVSLRLNTTTAT